MINSELGQFADVPQFYSRLSLVSFGILEIGEDEITYFKSEFVGTIGGENFGCPKSEEYED